MIDFGLIGAGRIGAIHARNLSLHPSTHLKYVCDVSSSAAQQLATASGAHAASVEQCLSDPAVKAIVIASPTDTHANLIQACAQAGKAIFCEKPLDLDIQRARASAEAARG